MKKEESDLINQEIEYELLNGTNHQTQETKNVRQSLNKQDKFDWFMVLLLSIVILSNCILFLMKVL